MSYATAAALQAAIFARLAADPALAALVGDAIFDAPPAGRLPPLWIALGAEDARDASDASGPGAEHRLTISVVGTATGFAQAKTAAAAVCDALADAPLALARGRLVGLRFLRAQARHGATGRRVDLVFRARVEEGR